MRTRVDEMLFGAVAALQAVLTVVLLANLAFPGDAAIMPITQLQAQRDASCAPKAQANGLSPGGTAEG